MSQMDSGQPPNMMQDVVDFHKKFDYFCDEPRPRVLPTDLFDFRNEFHLEETREYEEAQNRLEDERIAGKDHNPLMVTYALANQIDALVDAVWVLLGTAEIQFGADRFHEAWRRVAVANMAKVRANPQADTRSKRVARFDIVKPAGWVAPDHSDLVKDYAPFTTEGS